MRNFFNSVAQGQTPTLLEAQQANKVYAALNQLANITVVDADKTSIEYTMEGIKIKIEDKTKGLTDTVTSINVKYPLVAEQEVSPEGVVYNIKLEGYTQYIKYCGGEGHVFFLNQDYNSSQVPLNTSLLA